MWGFFIALFGGIFLLAKYAKDSGSQEAYEKNSRKRHESMTNDCNEWCEKVVDLKLERQVERDLYAGLYRDRIQKIVDNLYEQAKAEGLDMYDKRNQRFDMSEICLKYSLLIAMALNGKLPRHEAEYGIFRLSCDPLYKDDIWGMQNLLMLWIDNELHSHGIDEPMVFSSSLESFFSQKKKEDVILAKDAPLVHGTFGWWPIRIHL